MANSPYLSVRDAAEIMGLGKVTVTRLIREGHLPATNCNRSIERPAWRINRVDLDAYMSPTNFEVEGDVEYEEDVDAA